MEAYKSFTAELLPRLFLLYFIKIITKQEAYVLFWVAHKIPSTYSES